MNTAPGPKKDDQWDLVTIRGKHNTKKTSRNRLDLPISFVYLSDVGNTNSEFLSELEVNSCFCSVDPSTPKSAKCQIQEKSQISCCKILKTNGTMRKYCTAEEFPFQW